jgi:hypothetical protein
VHTASGASHLFRGDANNFQNLLLDLTFINSQTSATNLTVQQKKEKKNVVHYGLA